MGIFDGVRVADLSRYWAGPGLTGFMADNGAEVVKVEATTAIDAWRMGGATARTAPGQDGAPPYERSPVFNAVNRNKLGVTLDLRDTRGKAWFKRLVTISDVVVENYSTRVMPGLGLDYASLHEVNDQLIMISLPGFGGTGPWKDFIAFATPTEEASGITALTGYEGGEPMLSGNFAADAIAAYNGVFAVSAALAHRERTGQGQHVDLSQVECLTAFLGPLIMDYSMTGHVPPRLGNRDRELSPHGVFRCAGDDDWLAVAVRDHTDWVQLARCIGRLDLVQDPATETAAGRAAMADTIDAAIETWTRTQTARRAMVVLQSAGVPASVVMRPEYLVEDTHVRARQVYEWSSRTHVGSHPYPANVARYRRRPGQFTRPAPLLGEHNREVLQGLLGMSDAEFLELTRSGVVGDAIS